MTNHDSGLGAVIIVQEPLLESTLAIRGPHRFLGVIGLEHVLPLGLHGHREVGQRVRIGLTGLAKFDVAGHLGGWSMKFLAAGNAMGRAV